MRSLVENPAPSKSRRAPQHPASSSMLCGKPLEEIILTDIALIRAVIDNGNPPIPRHLMKEDMRDALWRVMLLRGAKGIARELDCSAGIRKITLELRGEEGVGRARVHQLYGYHWGMNPEQAWETLKSAPVSPSLIRKFSCLDGKTTGQITRQFDGARKEVVAGNPQALSKLAVTLMERACRVTHAIEHNQDPGGTLIDPKFVQFWVQIAYIWKHKGDVQAANKTLKVVRESDIDRRLKELFGIREPIATLLAAPLSDSCRDTLNGLDAKRVEGGYIARYVTITASRATPPERNGGKERRSDGKPVQGSLDTSLPARSRHPLADDVNKVVQEANARLSGIVAGVIPPNYSDQDLLNDCLLIAAILYDRESSLESSRPKMHITRRVGRAGNDRPKDSTALDAYLSSLSLSRSVIEACAPGLSEEVLPKEPYLYPVLSGRVAQLRATNRDLGIPLARSHFPNAKHMLLQHD